MYFKTRMKKLIFITASALIIAGCSPSDPAKKQAETNAQKEVKSAIAISDEIEKDPGNPELFYRRSNIYFNESYLDRAIADIDQALILAPNTPIYMFNKARILYAMNKTKEAAELYENVIKIKPDFIEAKVKLADLYYVVKEHKKSIDLLNVLLAENKANVDAYFLRGMNFKEMGDTASAISSFQKAYAIDDKNYDAVMQLASLYAAIKNKVALDYYVAGARIKPKSAEPPYGAGVFYQQQRDYKRAIKMYEQAVKADDRYFQAYYNAAIINMELNDFKTALDQLNMVVRIEQGFADAYYMRGLCYEQMKNKEDARLNYQYTLEINPKHKLASAALQTLK